MEAEFINVFIEKQRDHLMDFVSRVVMAEAKQHFADKEIAELTEKLRAAESFIGELQPMLDAKIDEVNGLNGRVEELCRIVDSHQLTIQAAATTHNDMKNQLDAAKAEYNDMVNHYTEAKKQRETAISERYDAKMKLEEAQALNEQADKDYKFLEATLASMNTHCEELNNKLRSTNKQYEELDHKYDNLNTKYKALTKVKKPGVDTPSS